MTQGNIYLDFNATTPVDPAVLELTPQWLKFWGNPSSIHHHGRGPKKLLRESRRSIARGLDCHPLELIFTSGGSESNNLALQGCLQELRKKSPKKNKILMGAIEHPSLLKQIPWLVEQGYKVVKIPVSLAGKYNIDFYESQLDSSVALVSVMLANNEVGLIAPLEDMIAKAHSVGALFHSDMVQALGKYPFDLKSLNLDLASFSSHKVYALKGCGLVYVKKGTPFSATVYGGAQERGRRAGTENLVAIASLANRLQFIEPEVFKASCVELRNCFEERLKKNIRGVEIIAEQAERLSNTSCFIVEGVSGESLLMNLDIRGFSVGTGAACSSGNPEPSPVLLALGLKREQAQSSLRISFGKTTTLEQVELFSETLEQVVEHLRSLNPETGVANV